MAVTYRFAIDAESGALTDIQALDERSRRPGWAYRCLGCRREMVARLGEIKQHHFAHRDAEALCAEEGYLHGLGIRAITTGFQKAVEVSKPYTLTFVVTKPCVAVERLGVAPCVVPEVVHLDITTWYRVCEPVSDGAGDLVLRSADGRHRLNISVWVTRRSRDQLPTDGSKWVDIRVVDEDRAEALHHGLDLTLPSNRHVGFDLTRWQQSIDCQGRCRGDRRLWSFVLYASGKTHAATNISVSEALKRAHQRSVVHAVTSEPRQEAVEAWFGSQVVACLEQGLPVRHCGVCRHRGAKGCEKGHDDSNGNRAADCTDFDRYACRQELDDRLEVLKAERLRILAEERSRVVVPVARLEHQQPALAPVPPRPFPLTAFSMTEQETLQWACDLTVAQVKPLPRDLQSTVVRCWGRVGLAVDGMPEEWRAEYEEEAKNSQQ